MNLEIGDQVKCISGLHEGETGTIVNRVISSFVVERRIKVEGEVKVFIASGERLELENPDEIRYEDDRL